MVCLLVRKVRFHHRWITSGFPLKSSKNVEISNNCIDQRKEVQMSPNTAPTKVYAPALPSRLDLGVQQRLLRKRITRVQQRHGVHVCRPSLMKNGPFSVGSIYVYRTNLRSSLVRSLARSTSPRRDRKADTVVGAVALGLGSWTLLRRCCK